MKNNGGFTQGSRREHGATKAVGPKARVGIFACGECASRKMRLAWLAALLLFFCVAAPSSGEAQKAPVFELISIDAAITPSIAEYIEKNIAEAAKGDAAGIIIRIDTPGGLDTAMRDIAKAILNAPLPVIVYVAPSGARAASAGVIIVSAAHVAAMAPGTNIGAAHPVGIGIGGTADKTMSMKVENDAVAYAQGIAKKRGRNEAWVEEAVRKSASITAEEALRLNVIDLMATDNDSLLRQIEGRQVDVNGVKRVIATAGAVVHEKTMETRDRILSALSNPNIAYILFLVGLAGLYFEFSTPGAILPGVIGGISLILALFAMQTLSINYAGVALIIFAIILFIAEIKIISHGILSIGGVVSLLIGSLMLFNTAGSSLRVSWSVLIPAVAITSLFFIVIVGIAMKAQLRPRQGGREGMTGQEGVAIGDVLTDGKVIVGGEYWDAVSDVPIAGGSPIRVVGVENLKLKVEPIEK
ncbi:MAG: NfeD family protein [Syntrophales bacterium]